MGYNSCQCGSSHLSVWAIIVVSADQTKLTDSRGVFRRAVEGHSLNRMELKQMDDEVLCLVRSLGG